MLDDALKKFEVRDRVKIIASGKITTPDRAAIVLAMGADLVQIARGFMISVGCIMAERCHTNECPAGVATTDPKVTTRTCRGREEIPCNELYFNDA